MRAVGKYNRVIYEETFGGLCCQPDQEGFDDNSAMYSGSTASETVRDDTGEVIEGMAWVGKEIAEVRRSRSMRRSRSFRRSSSMGRSRDKELTRGSRSMKRSRTPKGQRANKLQDASPGITHREEPPATFKAIPAFSALRRRAGGGKSSKNKLKGTKDNDEHTPAVLGEAHPMTRKQSRRKGGKDNDKHTPAVLGEAYPMTRKQSRRKETKDNDKHTPAVLGEAHLMTRKQPRRKETKDNDKRTPAVLGEAHLMTRKQSRRPSSPKGEKVLDDDPPMVEAHIITRKQSRRHNRTSRSSSSKGENPLIEDFKVLDFNPPMVMVEAYPLTTKQSQSHKSSRSSSSKRVGVLEDNHPKEEDSIIHMNEVLNSRIPSSSSSAFMSQMETTFERRGMAMF